MRHFVKLMHKRMFDQVNSIFLYEKPLRMQSIYLLKLFELFALIEHTSNEKIATIKYKIPDIDNIWSVV